MSFFVVQTAAVVFMVLLGSTDSRKSAFISGTVWKSSIQSCINWGEQSQTYSFNLPTLSSVGLSYEDFDELTTVVALFEKFEISTKAVKNANLSQIMLYNFVQKPAYKEYSSRFGYTAACGWASQAASFTVTLKVSDKGTLQLDTYVYAASWGAVTCADTIVDIAKLRVIY